MSSEKKLVAAVGITLFVVCLVTAVLMEREVLSSPNYQSIFDGSQPVSRQHVGDQSNSKNIRAMVTGSIYETGSNMTVYGMCVDGNNYLLSGANASFTAWYPNGSIMIGPNASMLPMEDYNASLGGGRWRVHVTMGSTIGTYLTEMRCDYQGQWATAYDEWQNPEWVKRIGDTYTVVLGLNASLNQMNGNLVNMSSDLNEFRSDVNQNFSTVLNEINSLSIAVSNGSATPEMVNELSNLVHSVDMNTWVLDSTNPFYVMASGVNNFYAVDMVGTNNVHVVGEEIAAYWDGSVWTYRNLSGTVMRGVSVLSANLPYAWYVGKYINNGTPVISINGATPYVPVLPGDTSNGLSDVKIFPNPYNPAGEFFVYLLANDGRVYFSNNSGVNWTYVVSVGNGWDGRIDVAWENRMSQGQSEGYVAMFGQGDKIAIYDAGIYTVYLVNGSVRDVSVLNSEKGFVLSKNVDGRPHVYVFSGTSMNLTMEYVIDDMVVEPRGLSAIASNDVWMVTSYPSIFYHFDGMAWKYEYMPVNANLQVMVSFNQSLGGLNILVGFENLSNFTMTGASFMGLQDVSMLNGKTGYAVGGDGMIFIFKNHYDERFDDLLANLTEQINSISVNFNLSNVNLSVDLTELIAMIQEMNQSMQDSFNALDNQIQQMNSSLQNKIDILQNTTNNVLSNVTYSQLYMETTVYPLVNSTYMGIQQLLIDMGILKAQMNQSLQLQNSTLQIVNQTDQKVDVLLNRSNRPKAWTTV